MDGLKIATAMFRAESVGDFSKPPQGVRVSRRGSSIVAVQSCEFAKDVTQLPTEFSSPRLLRLPKRVQEEVAVIPIICPICHDDLSSNDGAAKINNQSMGAVGLDRQPHHVLQAKSRVLFSEEVVLHFDLDPR